MQKDDVIRAEGKSAAKLYMKDGEIVNSYRLARDPRRQIGVLAELNAVPPSVIREVLAEAGELVLKPRKTGGGCPLSFDAAEARRLFDAGLSDEAWAVLRQRIEETKRDAKALEKLHSELRDAIKDGNEDEALIEMGAINANAAALCAAFAGMAAKAQRAVEESG